MNLKRRGFGGQSQYLPEQKVKNSITELKKYNNLLKNVYI